MAQPPFLVDQIQIEPGSPGDRFISRAADGSLQFTDSLVTSPVTLSQISGSGTIAGVRVVGSSGAGAQYTSIQDAIDSIPATSSLSEPYVILIHPGVYTEDVSLYRDGVVLQALGPVTLESALESTPDAVGNDHTLTLETASGSTPQWVWIRGMRITNAHQGKACVFLSGGAGSILGAGGIYLEDCILESTSLLGNHPVLGVEFNVLIWSGGSVRNTTDQSLVSIEQCALLYVDRVRGLPALSLSYDSGGNIPSILTSSYTIRLCDDIADGTILVPPIQVSLIGVGSFDLLNCRNVGDLTVQGNRTHTFGGCVLNDLDIQNTSDVVFVNTRIEGTVTGAVGTSLDSPLRGTVGFMASPLETVTFDVPQPDVAYYVVCTPSDQPSNTEVPVVANKQVTGFDIMFSTNQTLNVDWILVR